MELICTLYLLFIVASSVCFCILMDYIGEIEKAIEKLLEKMEDNDNGN
jgi:hypothetical protein